MAQNAPDNGRDYHQRWAESLTTLELHALDALRVAKPGSPTHLSACSLMLKIQEFRHSTYLKHQEALEVDRLSSALEEINAHLAGHHAPSSGLAEDSAAEEREESGP